MRRIIVGAMFSMDGVMQAPGAATEDPTECFKFGGWMTPYHDWASGEESNPSFSDVDLLLGRRTYEIFAAYWPCYDEDGAGGKRLFNDGSVPHSFDLISSRVSSTGTLIGHNERASRIRIHDVAPDSSSARDAGRKRLQREG